MNTVRAIKVNRDAQGQRSEVGPWKIEPDDGVSVWDMGDGPCTRFLSKFDQSEFGDRVWGVTLHLVVGFDWRPEQFEHVAEQFGAALMQEVLGARICSGSPLVGFTEVGFADPDQMEPGDAIELLFQGLIDMGPREGRGARARRLRARIRRIWPQCDYVDLRKFSEQSVLLVAKIVAGADDIVCASPFWCSPENRELFPSRR